MVINEIKHSLYLFVDGFPISDSTSMASCFLIKFLDIFDLVLHL